jgi:hypothetical protein
MTVAARCSPWEEDRMTATSANDTSRHFGALQNFVAIGAIADIEQRALFASIQSSLRRRVAVPVERLIASSDHHALDVEMVVEAFGAEFAADA